MVIKFPYLIKYIIIYNTRQAAATNKIPQQRQQRRQRCPTLTSPRHTASQAGWDAVAPAAVVFDS